VWVELPQQVDALELHKLALSHDISVAPGHLFSADPRFSHHLRINFGHPDHAGVGDAIRTVGQIARALS
jgi:DNA-binding transcriptional MocR family regulator